MTRGKLALRLALIVGGTALAFVLLQHPMRVFETSAAAGLLRLLGAHDAQVVDGTSIQIMAGGNRPLLAEITPACSSLASLVAIIALGVVVPMHVRRSRGVAVGAATAIVLGGNVVRIAASVGLGYVAGRSALVLFHDWVGSAFAFAYTLGGFLVMLWLVLPADPAKEPEPQATAATRRHRAHARHRSRRARHAVDGGIAPFAEDFLTLSRVHQDGPVLDELAAAVARTQWEPASPAVVDLRTWAREYYEHQREGDS